MIIATFPGRFGDLLWAMPTVRALAVANGPVRLEIAGQYGSIAPLLRQQDYLESVTVREDWQVVQTAPMTPWAPVDADAGPSWKRVHLGYRGWPDHKDLPRTIYSTLGRYYPEVAVAQLDLDTPWITQPHFATVHGVAVGFTDEHFELKYGIYKLTNRRPWSCEVLFGPGSRWATEANIGRPYDWVASADVIKSAKVFLGCCSALHVLSCAIGTPCIIMEPAEARWNPVFWPYGMDGPKVTVVRGNDGKPTFDARTVRQKIEEALR